MFYYSKHGYDLIEKSFSLSIAPPQVHYTCILVSLGNNNMIRNVSLIHVDIIRYLNPKYILFLRDFYKCKKLIRICDFISHVQYCFFFLSVRYVTVIKKHIAVHRPFVSITAIFQVISRFLFCRNNRNTGDYVNVREIFPLIFHVNFLFIYVTKKKNSKENNLYSLVSFD